MIASEALTGQAAYVTVLLDNERTDVLKYFRCNSCGKLLFAYYDTVTYLAPGKAENLEGCPRIVKCRGSIRVGEKQFNTVCRQTYYIY